MKKRLLIKNRIKETALFKSRLWLLVALILILMFALLIRLAYLQTFERNYYTTLSSKNNITLEPIAPKRGLIYDRYNRLLAQNLSVFNIMVTRTQVDDFQSELQKLQQIIPITAAELHDYYREARQKRAYEPVPLKVNLTAKEVAKFAVNRYLFPGFNIQPMLMRTYPESDIMANVIGYVGRINAEELTRIDPSNYAATNYIGKVGIENSFEQQLHGTVGYRRVEINAAGETIRTLNTKPALAGANLYLTIDSQLQRAAQKALHGHRGAIVAVQPATGQILALVSEPTFDPNLFVKGLDFKTFAQLQNDPHHPLYNRPIRGLYPPGSTIKPFMGLAGLDTNTITPASRVYDPGWFKIKGTEHIYHNWMRGGFGWVNLKEAILHSDDVYFYNLATYLGIDNMDNYLTQFGFGQKTGIAMNEELAGAIPSPEYKMKLTGQRWYTGDTVTTGIGQSYFQVTPLQLAMATATLAMHGKRMQAEILKAYQLPDQPLETVLPHQIAQIVLNKPQYWDEVIAAMRAGVVQPDGTSHMFGFGNPPYPAAAKTGTAQVHTTKNGDTNILPEQERDNSLFIAFAPIQHPQIAITVMVEHNPSAPRIARQVMDYYMLTQKHWPQRKNNNAH